MTPTGDGPISVGLVGCGAWGALILRDLLELGCAVTVVDADPAACRRAEAVGAVALQGTSPVDVLGDARGVVVATPTTTHVDVVEGLLPLDVPLFVEKPLSNEPSGPRRLAALAPDRIFMMHKWRHHPGVQVLADLARRRVLGDVEGLKLVRTGWDNPFDDVDAVWVLAPHDLSIVLEILGSIPPPQWAVGRHEPGRRTSLVGVLGDHPWVHLDVGSCSGRRERRIELQCAEGVAVLADGYDEEILVRRGNELGPPVEERLPALGEMPLLAELRRFVGYLHGGPAPLSTVADEVALIDALVGLRTLAGLP
jgi:predicted dehydrogenase